MQHDPIPTERSPQSFDLAGFAKRTVEAGILAARDDKSEMKFRIMLARQCGFLSDDETRLWIIQHDLGAA
ncbi:hypothetical protein [Allopontixanthobacter sediminis]|uniref:Uncharacterized protein n=1 Tax=Allopontixanthobacter sediminis TaxID=1689985 RepID=A0A845B0L4_9SPHN|nr:hypothetical protein [Allopontixanthobacter sediminis]MXP42967.1 hypothetical protein [Allopontixanthobacter sediminis]